MSSIRRWIDRAATPRPRVDGFMGLNDRTLADIGVRRIDVQAAQSGIVPARRIWAPATAEVCPLRRARCQGPSATRASDVLSAAA